MFALPADPTKQPDGNMRAFLASVAKAAEG